MSRIRWKRLADEGEVRAVLLRELPLGTPVETVRAFLAEHGLPNDEVEDSIRFSAPGRGSLFISVQWLMKFGLREGRVVGVSVRRSLTGP
jgi:hypothetical protein